MKQETKVIRLEQLRELFTTNETFIVTDFKGISVNSINELRKKLNSDKISYLVVKNTLARKALAEAGKEEISAKLSGTNAIAFSGDDPVTAAKILKDFAKKEKKLDIKFGVLSTDYLDKNQVEELADMPDYPTLLAKFAMLLNTPVTNFARLMVEPVSGFARLIKQLSEKQEN